jgi:molecular chaperone DnaK (HSP70)
MEQAIHDANLTIYDISQIIPMGGMAITPTLQAHLFQRFHTAIEIRDSIPPQSVIATGLAKILHLYQYHDTIIGNYTTSILSLGIRTAGAVIMPIIHRISILPAERSHVFTTVKDNQSCAIIELYEGDRPIARNNRVLARIEVEKIPLAKRGVPRVGAFLLSIVNFEMTHSSFSASDIAYYF